MQIIKLKEKKQIIEQLNKQFGIQDLPYLLLRFGKEKIRAYSGSLSTEELKILDKTLNIETIGIYFAAEINNELRLSLDAIQLLKNQISKNILEIDNEQAEKWFKGQELLIKTDRNFKILKNNNEFIGCGKSTGEKIANFMPKERRIKS